MSRVYRAELTGAGGFSKPVALKIVDFDDDPDPKVRRAVLDEAKLTALLKHPNIVETYDVGEVEDATFISMELVDGWSLQDLMDDEPIPGPVALELLIQLCEGLVHAHELTVDGRRVNLIHRDLKPSNALVDRRGVAQLMDFGIARADEIVNRTTVAGGLKGTPRYMSPEQATGQPLDQRSDLFSMGSLIYAVTTGEHLFGGEQVLQVVADIVSKALDYTAIAARVDRRVPGLGDVTARCLQRDPGARFQSSAELLDRLKPLRTMEVSVAEWLKQHPSDDDVTAFPTSPTDDPNATKNAAPPEGTPDRTAGRDLRWVTAGLLVLLVALAAAAFSLTKEEEDPPPDENATERPATAAPDVADDAWRGWLRDFTSLRRRAVLRERAEGLADGARRSFFVEISGPLTAPTACEGLDLEALAAAHPDTIGSLAEAACRAARWDYKGALFHARKAWDHPPLRATAAPLVRRLLAFTQPCPELLRQLPTLLEATPNDIEGWSHLASTYARCGAPEQARAHIAKVEALLTDEMPARQRLAVSREVAVVFLNQLDLEAARPWLDTLERLHDPDDPDRKYYEVTSLGLFLQGRYQAGLERLRDGVDRLRDEIGIGYAVLAASRFYVLIGLQLVDEANRVARDMDRILSTSGDPADRYQALIARAAVNAARGTLTTDKMPQWIETASRKLDQLNDMGRAERDAQLGLLYSHVGTADQCETILNRADPANKLLGGCRLLVAERLLNTGKPFAARRQYERALTEILGARFLYAQMVPAALMGLARARLATGEPKTAREALRRLTTNYANADRTIPEVDEAALLLQAIPP